jgi:hypothetical protein
MSISSDKLANGLKRGQGSWKSPGKLISRNDWDPAKPLEIGEWGNASEYSINLFL